MSVLKMYSNEMLFHIPLFYNQVYVSNKPQKVLMKETIAKKLFITEYSEPCQTSRMERFAKIIKGALSGLRKILATESRLKTMKNAFYFTLKALFVLNIFKFLSLFYI